MEHTNQNAAVPLQNKRSVLTRLSNFIKRGYAWLTGKNSAEIVSANKEPAKGPVEEMLDSIKAETEEYKKYLSLPEVENYFMHGALFMTNTGFSDGVYGNRAAREKEVKVLSESRATRLCDLANAALNGNLARVSTEEQATEQLMIRNKTQDEEQHRDLEKQLYYQRNHSRSYNLLWGLLCLGAAAGLAAADYPLSKKLLGDGFNFPENDYKLTAIGLVLCTFFIKIFFDNYIDVKYGNALLSERDFYDMYAPREKKEKNGPEEAELKKNKQELSKKEIWYTAIFLLTIAGIIVLSFFRADALVNKWHGDAGLRTATFLFLTLIFPLISGICLSIGLNVFENYFRIRRTRRRCRETTAKFIQSLKEHTVLKEERENLENELKKWNNSDAFKTYSNILLAYYDNGYKRGSYEPDYLDKELDFFARVENWRNKIITRKSNLQIIKSAGL